MAIDQGIPPLEEWPPGVLDQLRDWEQGDVVESPPLFYFADPSRPIFASTSIYSEGSPGPEIVVVPDEYAPPFGLVTTATCDIAEEGRPHPVRPWAQVSPVYEITDAGWKKKLNRGRGPKFWIALPTLGEAEQVYAADLRIELPVEKGWLASQVRIEGFEQEDAKEEVGARLAWLRGRPAFSDDFNQLIFDPLHALLEGRPPDDADEISDADMADLEELCALVDNRLNPSDVQLVFLSERDMPEAFTERIQHWADTVVEQATQAGITLQAIDFRVSNDVPVSEYRRMIQLWFRQA